MKTFKIKTTDEYYVGPEPHKPNMYDLWATEDEGYLKVLTWMDQRWCIVTSMEIVPETHGLVVEITYDDEGDIEDEFELQNYQYRIGVL